jgi:hypothetical protein
MATSPNYGWTEPDDTSLVKDGAAAMRTLGNAIDSTVYANAQAAIAKTLIDAKGDLIAGSAADTAARLAVGANDTVLTADSTAATGLKWAAPASGGMTLISTTTVSGSTVTLSSIPQTYNDLVLILKNIYGSTAGANFSLRFNGVGTGSTYDNLQSYETTLNGSFDDNQVRVLENQANTSSQGLVSIYIPNYTNSTSWKFAHTVGVQNDSTDTNWRGRNTIGFSNATSAVSSLTIFAAAGTFTAGTILLYGVK